MDASQLVQTNIKLSTLQEEGAYHASKFLSIQLLVTLEALKELLAGLRLFQAGVVVTSGEEELTLTAYCKRYEEYLEALCSGQVPRVEVMRGLTVFAAENCDDLYAIEVGEGQRVIRQRGASLQIQHHTLHYSTDDHRFRSMTLGEGAIHWGLQLTFPQLVQNPKTGEIEKTDLSLFKKLQRWARRETLPTTFRIGETQIATPYRLSPGCVEWIDGHPDLLREEIEVLHGNR